MTRRPSIRRGDVFMATYTFPHEQRAKERPILILQTDLDNANDRYPIVLAAPITTQKSAIRPYPRAHFSPDEPFLGDLTLGQYLDLPDEERARLWEEWGEVEWENLSANPATNFTK